MAVLLAQQGFDGPRPVLEGRFGVLDAFCDRSEAGLLIKGLGETYDIKRLCIKRYACHATAQTPVQLLRDLMTEYSFNGRDIASLTLTVSDKVLSHHAERRPIDLMLAQYSVPFSVAIAAHRDPDDPRSFSDDVLADDAILDLAEQIVLEPGRPKGWGAHLAIHLREGRKLAAEGDTFVGCPETPFSDADIRRKFERLTASEDSARMSALLSKLIGVETLSDCLSIADA
jgi:2-methylcitrate dehydratase PrpD